MTISKKVRMLRCAASFPSMGSGRGSLPVMMAYRTMRALPQGAFYEVIPNSRFIASPSRNLEV
jgi:hypothetical protein